MCHGTLTGSFAPYQSHTILKLNATGVGGCTLSVQLLVPIIVRVCIIEDGESCSQKALPHLPVDTVS